VHVSLRPIRIQPRSAIVGGDGCVLKKCSNNGDKKAVMVDIAETCSIFADKHLLHVTTGRLRTHALLCGIGAGLAYVRNTDEKFE